MKRRVNRLSILRTRHHIGLSNLPLDVTSIILRLRNAEQKQWIVLCSKNPVKHICSLFTHTSKSCLGRTVSLVSLALQTSRLLIVDNVSHSVLPSLLCVKHSLENLHCQPKNRLTRGLIPHSWDTQKPQCLQRDLQYVEQHRHT